MPDSQRPKNPNDWLPVRRYPPPADVPLDETVAHIHFVGDIKGKYDGPDGPRKLYEEMADQSWSARLKRFLGLQQ